MKGKTLRNSLIGLVVIVVLTVVLIMCANPLYDAITKAGRAESTESYTPGTYVAEAEGFGGTVTVKITVDDSGIADVEIDAPDETEAIGGAAVPTLRSDILNKQSADIDGVSGATLTSNAIIAGVTDCIAQAAAE